MNMKRIFCADRVLSLVMAILMTIALLPTGASAAEAKTWAVTGPDAIPGITPVIKTWAATGADGAERDVQGVGPVGQIPDAKLLVVQADGDFNPIYDNPADVDKLLQDWIAAQGVTPENSLGLEHITYQYWDDGVKGRNDTKKWAALAHEIVPDEYASLSGRQDCRRWYICTWRIGWWTCFAVS